MEFLRILSRVAQYRLARAVLALLLVAVAAMFGTSKAHAQAYPTASAAWSACQSAAAGKPATSNSGAGFCTACNTGAPSCALSDQRLDGYSVYYGWSFGSPGPPWSIWAGHAGPFTFPPGCPTGTARNDAGQCVEDCSSLPDITTTNAPVLSTVGVMTSGSLYCKSPTGQTSCAMAAFQNPDGTWTSTHLGGADCSWDSLKDECEALSGFYWSQGTQTCNADPNTCATGEAKDPVTGQCKEQCPAGMTLQADGTCKPSENECPPGNIKSPSGQCLPGEGQCGTGEARKQDGTCGIDADGDGEADAEDDDPTNDPDKESFSGGDNCNQPPTCEGGMIDCGIARITWRIECNTRKNENISGGACSAVPICTGEKCSAMEYSQLLMQWRATCALEKMATDTPGDGDDDDEAPVSTAGILGEDLDPGSVTTEVGDDGANGIAFDTSGKGWGGSCPQPPVVALPNGQSLTFDTAIFCDWMHLGGIFVMIMAHLAGLAIVVRS